MDLNLLPNELRNQENKEQAKLKKQPAGFGLELNSPHVEKAKSNWLNNLLGSPVSPVIDSAKPAIAPPKTELRLSNTNPATEKKAVARKPAGDSWGQIISGMFGFDRKKRIDFRLASNKREIKAPLPRATVYTDAKNSLPAPEAREIKTHQIVSKRNNPATIAILTERKDSRQDSHEAKPAKSAYNIVPKREKTSEFSVNLMPQEILAHLSTQKVNNISIIWAIAVPILIITLGYGVIILLQNDLKARLTARQQEFNGLQTEILDYIAKENQNNQTADRVAAVKKLLDEKNIWNNFFTYLEKYSLDGVYFSDLTADTSGVLTLPGMAENYNVLSQQLAVLDDADDFIKSVKLNNAQLVSEGKAGVVGVGFQLRLTLQDGVFKNLSDTK